MMLISSCPKPLSTRYVAALCPSAFEAVSTWIPCIILSLSREVLACCVLIDLTLSCPGKLPIAGIPPTPSNDSSEQTTLYLLYLLYERHTINYMYNLITHMSIISLHHFHFVPQGSSSNLMLAAVALPILTRIHS
jgi:hypothetical protein